MQAAGRELLRFTMMPSHPAVPVLADLFRRDESFRLQVNGILQGARVVTYRVQFAPTERHYFELSADPQPGPDAPTLNVDQGEPA